MKNHPARHITLCSLIFVFSFLISCSPDPKPKLEGPVDELIRSTAKSRRLLAEYQEIKSPPVERYFRNLAYRLGLGLYNLTRTQISPQFLLLSSSEPFAYHLGAGTFAISSEMIAVLQNEDELAFVLAHEYGHEVLGHSPQGGFNELAELEADEFGVKLMREANYNPKSALAALARFKLELGEASLDRIEAVKKQIYDLKHSNRSRLSSRGFYEMKSYLIGNEKLLIN